MGKTKIKRIISEMTLEEKVSFLTGKDFWHLRDLDRLGIPETSVTDGPHGLRKQIQTADHLGIGESNTAICFPAGCALASGFDPTLAGMMGEELGKLAQAEDVSVVLGPAVNIKRSPLCGRNFEYYSEDPLVSGMIAASMVKGLQSQDVGACPKHYLANNQEYYRMTSNSEVDDRTMREIYLVPFEKVVKDARPWTMMCSYNRVNGVYACENKKYLTEILRDEWGFDGYVMTDWGACDAPVESIASGLDLIMPGPGKDQNEAILSAVKSGTLDETTVDQTVERILDIIFRYSDNHRKDAVYNFDSGHNTARHIAKECAVLLKNIGDTLPLNEEEKILFVGPFVKQPRFQGGGSSHINPYKVVSAWECVKDLPTVSYAEGYSESGKEELLDEACEKAKTADKVVIFAGLPDSYETEGEDRRTIDLPECQNQLIKAIAEIQPNTIVVLHNGAPVAMPWINQVKAVLEMYLAGEASGEAAADLLYGKSNPCGRLAETFPMRIEDTPTYPYYGVEKDDVPYREGVFVGYRYYETVKRDTLFPFGYGLSYTSFVYSDLKIDRERLTDEETMTVSVTVTNTGKIPGKEVIQLYVAGKTDGIPRPVRELRAFDKIYLEPGESKQITFTLGKRAFAYWNARNGKWSVSSGIYQIQIGKSSADIALKKEIWVESTENRKPVFTLNSPLGDIMSYPAAREVVQKLFDRFIPESGNQDMDSTNSVSSEMMPSTSISMPLRGIPVFIPEMGIKQLEQLLVVINQAVEHS